MEEEHQGMLANPGLCGTGRQNGCRLVGCIFI